MWRLVLIGAFMAWCFAVGHWASVRHYEVLTRGWRPLYAGLAALTAEDPTLRVQDGQAGQVTIGCMGEMHLEIIVDRMRREFGVEASLGKPLIAFKETLTRAADGDPYCVAGCAAGVGVTGAAWACASAAGRSIHAVVRPVLNAVTPVRAIPIVASFQ